MIIRARSVVTMDGAVIENGAVAIAGDTIAAVGSWPEVQAQRDGEVIDVGECVLLPGFINAHCHLDYTCLRGAIPPPKSFTGWIRAINAAKASLTADDYRRSISDGFAEAAAFGTTTLVNLEAFPRLAASFDPPPLRTWWFAEMIDVREAVHPAELCAQMSAAISGPLARIGLAPHAPFTASRNLYAEAAQLARHHDLLLTTHLAESREEMQMFRDADGALFDFMQSIGRLMDDCGVATPLQLLLRDSLLDERWIVAHLNESTLDDFRLLERAARFHIAHCPRSHAYFGHSPFAAQKLCALGFNICIGTDSLASNDDLSLLAELRQFAKTQPTLSPLELLEMITVNPARALRQPHSLGRIKVGYAADLTAVPASGAPEDTLATCIHFAGKVPWSMVNGRPSPT
jgi:cytosine/adenosine deaminase-related metal-dependent hydrolase